MKLIKFSAKRLMYEMFLERIGFDIHKDNQTRFIYRKGKGRGRHGYHTTYHWEMFDINCKYGYSPYIKRRKIECLRSQKKQKLRQWKP